MRLIRVGRSHQPSRLTHTHNASPRLAHCASLHDRHDPARATAPCAPETSSRMQAMSATWPNQNRRFPQQARIQASRVPPLPSASHSRPEQGGGRCGQPPGASRQPSLQPEHRAARQTTTEARRQRGQRHPPVHKQSTRGRSSGVTDATQAAKENATLSSQRVSSSFKARRCKKQAWSPPAGSGRTRSAATQASRWCRRNQRNSTALHESPFVVRYSPHSPDRILRPDRTG